MIDLDRDPGDYDSTEVHQAPLDAWHPSHQPATPKPIDCTPTDNGRHCLQTGLAILKARQSSKTAVKPSIPKTCWRDTPEPFRRLLARAAGLPADVCDKLDRDLTESEKALIRAAAKRLRERADALFAL